jgi:hypothetical protein
MPIDPSLQTSENYMMPQQLAALLERSLHWPLSARRTERDRDKGILDE